MEAEQGRLLRDVSTFRERFRGKGIDWNRLRGDAYARVVCHYLAKRLPPRKSLALNSWVEGSGIEFDVLVLAENAKPESHASIYPGADVDVMVEVKGSGHFHKRADTTKKLRAQKKRVLEETGKPILALLLWEGEKRAESVYLGLGREDAFILKVGDSEVSGEWDRFVRRVNILCGEPLHA